MSSTTFASMMAATWDKTQMASLIITLTEECSRWKDLYEKLVAVSKPTPPISGSGFKEAVEARLLEKQTPKPVSLKEAVEARLLEKQTPKPVSLKEAVEAHLREKTPKPVSLKEAVEARLREKKAPKPLNPAAKEFAPMRNSPAWDSYRKTCNDVLRGMFKDFEDAPSCSPLRIEIADSIFKYCLGEARALVLAHPKLARVIVDKCWEFKEQNVIVLPAGVHTLLDRAITEFTPTAEKFSTTRILGRPVSVKKEISGPRTRSRTGAIKRRSYAEIDSDTD